MLDLFVHWQNCSLLSFKNRTNHCWFTLSVFLSHSLCMCLYFCCVSVLGKVPADLLLLTALTSAPPDLGETVIVSASALNGSAGCFQATQLVYVYLFFCQPPSCCGPIARLAGFSTLGSFSFFVFLCPFTCSLQFGNNVHLPVNHLPSHIKLVVNAWSTQLRRVKV